MTATRTEVLFETRAGTLAEACAQVARRVPARPEPAVLGGILLLPNDGTLLLSAFDYDVAVTASIELPVVTTGDGVLVAGRLLAELAKTLPPDATVTASVEGAALALACGRIRLSLPLMPAEDYPTLPASAAMLGTFAAADLRAAVERVIVAADLAGRTSQPALTGVEFVISGERARLQANNGYRAAWTSIPWHGTGDDARTLIPGEALGDFVRALPDDAEFVEVGVEDSGVATFRHPGATVTARTLDAAGYRDFAGIVSQRMPRADEPIVVRTADLVAAVKRANLVIAPGSPVHLDLASGEIAVSGGADARTAETIEAQGITAAQRLTLRPAYLLDGLGALRSEMAEITLAGPRMPVMLTAADDPDFRYIQQPLRN